MNRSEFVRHRQTRGSCWLSVFEDIEIPWRQLTLEEFLYFETLFKDSRYTETEIEDEIFLKICLDTQYKENLDILKSGIISSVVAHAMQNSGPSTIEQISNDLNIARSLTSDFISSGITLICSVFVSYKPEDLYKLDYQDFMKRLALAERRLLELGVLSEPISVLNPSQESEPVRQKQPPKTRKVEERFADLNPPTPTSNKTVITGKQMSSAEVSGHDLTDKALWQHDALQGLENVYPEYFKLMKEGKKITPEVINSVKGTSFKEVERNHENYIGKILSGEIKPEPSKYLIADKLESGSTNKGQKKVKVKRIKG